MKHILYVLLAIPSLCMSAPLCVEGNALPPEKRALANAVGAEWLEHALYCNFGAYQVMVSTDPKSDAIMIFRAQRPFVSYDQGTGINLIQDFPTKKAVPYLSVQDWDHTGIFRRLDYLITDEAGNTIDNAQDKNMSGNLVLRKADRNPKK